MPQRHTWPEHGHTGRCELPCGYRLRFEFVEAEGEVKQAISVLKNRSGNHERTIREFKMTGHIQVGRPLVEFSGVLSGVPVFTGKGKLLHGSRSGNNS